MSAAEPDPGWTAYWEDIGDRRTFAVEARDHVSRLRAAVPLGPSDRVLDFGCGFGHAVELLAPVVAEVGYWDGAAAMRRATADRTARFPRVFPVDLGRPAALGASGRFDVVLVNSVVQYVGRDELPQWVVRWRALLAPGGRIVLSDVPSPRTSSVCELLGLVRFALRNRFLVRAVREGVREAVPYARSRGGRGLTRWTPDEIGALAAAAGLGTEVLPANLTHRRGRFTVVLRPR